MTDIYVQRNRLSYNNKVSLNDSEVSKPENRESELASANQQKNLPFHTPQGNQSHIFRDIKILNLD